MKTIDVLKSFFIFLFGLIYGVEPLKITANANSEQCVLYTVMYHSILNSKDGVYIVSEAQLESDLEAYREKGFTSVFPSEVIAFAEGKGVLPEKPLLITFDDGHYNNLYYGLPLLKKYESKAVFNIVGAYSEFSTSSGDSDNPNYSHLTWAEIKDLNESGIVEIGNHTYNMHKYKPRYGIEKLEWESEEEYAKNISYDIARLQMKLKKECNFMPEVFAYPFGKISPASPKILADLGFKMMLTCYEGVSKVTKGDITSLYSIRRFNRSGKYSTEEFIKKLENAKNKAIK